MISHVYHLDFETYSPEDLPSVGAHRYACHPYAEILMLAISCGDEGPYLWVKPKYDTLDTLSDPRAFTMMRAMVGDPLAVIWAHNAGFESSVARWRWVLDTGLPPPELLKFRCTAALCRAAGLPAKLLKAAEVLELAAQKDTAGSALIRKFCCPQKDGSRIWPSQAWGDFVSFGHYCLQDVRAEKELHDRLRDFEFSGAWLEAWLFDLKLNARGFPVNVQALRNAQVIIDECMADVGVQFYKMVGLQASQRQAVKDWFKTKGLDLPDMTADTVEATLASLSTSSPVRPALHLYSQLQYAAVKKIQTMLDTVCPDGYIRGMFLFYGAGTGRWSGQVVQPHNFKRPTVKDTDLAYRLICQGCDRATLDILWGNCLDVLSSCIRNFMQWLGGLMMDADYAAIEARIVCWLSGQEDTLEEFRKGVDSYKSMAAHVYGCSIDDIKNPSHEREVGKRAVLGCGFNMGAAKFKEQCEVQYGIIISEELAELAVSAYRSKNHKVASMWEVMDSAARAAIARPGQTFKARDKLKFTVRTLSKVPYLQMLLPSGRTLSYPWPDIEMVTNKKYGRARDQITFFGHIKGVQWGRVSTYGGKLLENATQATAADIMAHGAVVATRRGTPIVALIHDQSLALQYKGHQLRDYINDLTTLPPWAKGLPIKADGSVVPYYRKS